MDRLMLLFIGADVYFTKSFIPTKELYGRQGGTELGTRLPYFKLGYSILSNNYYLKCNSGDCTNLDLLGEEASVNEETF